MFPFFPYASAEARERLDDDERPQRGSVRMGGAGTAIRTRTRVQLAIALIASGCAGGGESIETTLRAAYAGFRQAVLDSNDPPDPDHPDIGRYATGGAAAALRDAARSNEQRLRSFRLPTHRPDALDARYALTVMAVGSEAAIVSVCRVDDTIVFHTDTGATIDDDVVTKLMLVTFAHEDGIWRVDGNRRIAHWDGVGGCAG